MAVNAAPMTLERFLELPEEEPALEFFEGSVCQKVSPKGKHSRLQIVLAKLISDFAEPKQLAMVFTELRATYGGASFVPDISVYRWHRVPFDEQDDIAEDFREPPDIAVEIVSPTQSTNALVRRCLWYVENGVELALLIDPQDRSVLSFRPGQVTKPLADTDLFDVSDILPGFQLTVRQLFASLRRGKE